MTDNKLINAEITSFSQYQATMLVIHALELQVRVLSFISKNHMLNGKIIGELYDTVPRPAKTAEQQKNAVQEAVTLGVECAIWKALAQQVIQIEDKAGRVYTENVSKIHDMLNELNALSYLGKRYVIL